MSIFSTLFRNGREVIGEMSGILNLQNIIPGDSSISTFSSLGLGKWFPPRCGCESMLLYEPRNNEDRI